MARKQTSARISSAAARLLAKLPKRGVLWLYAREKSEWPWIELRVGELRSICASALSQDETNGQRKIDRRTKSPTGMTATVLDEELQKIDAELERAGYEPNHTPRNVRALVNRCLNAEDRIAGQSKPKRKRRKGRALR